MNKITFVDPSTAIWQLDDDILNRFGISSEDVYREIQGDHKIENFNSLLSDIFTTMAENAFPEKESELNYGLLLDGKDIIAVISDINQEKEMAQSILYNMLRDMFAGYGEGYEGYVGYDDYDDYEDAFQRNISQYPPYPHTSSPYLERKVLAFQPDADNSIDPKSPVYGIYRFEDIHKIIAFAKRLGDIAGEIQSTVFRNDDGLFLYMEKNTEITKNFIVANNMVMNYCEEQDDIYPYEYIAHLRETKKNGEIILDNNALTVLQDL